MAALRHSDVHEVPAQVQVDCHSLANGDDVFIEPPYRRPQRHCSGKGDCLDYRFGGVLESGINESGLSGMVVCAGAPRCRNASRTVGVSPG